MVDNGAQGIAVVLTASTADVATHQLQLRPHLVCTFQLNQPSAPCQMFINRALPAAKNAVHGYSKRCSLAIHGPATADDDIGKPDQIQTTHRLLGNDDFP